MPQLQNRFKIISNKKICPRFFKLSLDAGKFAASVKPGQFIHIKVSETLVPFLRRPFSIYRAKTSIEVLYEPIGIVTKALATRKAGESLDILGPLGNSFRLPPKGTQQVVMIGGGIGVAPFLVLSDILAKKDYEIILLYGGRTKDHVFGMEEFRQNGCRVYVATDDGSVGVYGKVSKLFSKI